MLSEYFTPTIDGASNCKIVTHGDSEIYLLCWLLGNIVKLRQGSGKDRQGMVKGLKA